jgi:hypothetical protein
LPRDSFHDGVEPLTEEEHRIFERVGLSTIAYQDELGVKRPITTSPEELLL